MGETAPRADMAKKVFEHVFKVFGWETNYLYDQNTACCLNAMHKKSTHPSDIVCWYDDPYENSRKYINIDLKSYGLGSIAPGKLRDTLVSMCQAVECANVNDDWQQLYVEDQEVEFKVHGLVFIYNHDGLSESSGFDILSKLKDKEIPGVVGQRTFVLGPSDVVYLTNIAHDVNFNYKEQGSKVFWHPDLVLKKKKSKNPGAARIENLIAPWQLMRGVEKNANNYTVYYRESGEDVDEFVYLLDMLFAYQLIEDKNRISIKLPNADKRALVNFKSAKEKMNRRLYGCAKERLDLVSYESMTTRVDRFSEVDMGFDIP
jgi:hypothetical protein